MLGCQNGCPCDDGFVCQEYVGILCQAFSTVAGKIDYSYVLSGDGLYKENRFYTVPELDITEEMGSYKYLSRMGHAELKGIIYLFGGTSDKRKIAYIDNCEIIDTGMRLLGEYGSESGSLVTLPEVESEVILCIGFDTPCESFDGSVSRSIAPTKVSHRDACMALYEDQALIIAGEDTATVELLNVSGWVSEPSHPAGKIHLTSCVSTENGVIVAGGKVTDFEKTVYLFRNKKWSSVGQLRKATDRAAMIYFENYFLLLGGHTVKDFAGVERVEWDGNEVNSSKIINEHEGSCANPIVFEMADPNECKNSCSDIFCFI